ncbi:MAG TPA: DNA-binding protein WhiA [Candidatus Monoglobus merdigallinarum]|uniref:Probable cell division protein WhiA n=1 Tax=Candidatus Monoglobus merdigallinarum TaxID=2838698 RepID=A0A9D1PP94_9FIRM|nr:DNA-binding protein WhiA [Candidatus Monoglobus merdigallinarum]
MTDVIEKKSFSRFVKEEIYKTEISDKCCVNARFIGLLLFGASKVTKSEIRLVTDNPDVLGSFVELSRLLGNEAEVRQNSERHIKYKAVISDSVKVAQLLYDLKLLDEHGNIRFSDKKLKRLCCKREFLRGAFLGAGFVSDPEKNYSLEIVTPYRELAEAVVKTFREVGFELRLSLRKNRFVAYVKNSETIADILTFLGAWKAQMALLNIKIEKEIRNDVNRSANGETSNLSKTINASVEQIQAIQKIIKTDGLDSLPEDLREIALLRMENKDLSLSELGKLLNPPLTKSGVNHRMQKIIKQAVLHSRIEQ